ncbi:DEAD/DEAH box helicase [Pontibacter sp. BT310]|uniref:DEAD/DEAH box helicase n=1 Tax=Pontibacter populi TaxID=890055 RepID=A0ABS6XF43_9BACT|nr:MULTISPECIES: DEAD/DEAH box helicase [Pontibacter]MBJ6119744.1 DEAD/DEAH box helicase [Pontibacter sp. BT310]MBR0572173.1 DEAD/DEAH box helicase [Microvirga sp. STS03]MBW3366597.1 DEAD/DEAH box helicase [Pontibacter populi]
MSIAALGLSQALQKAIKEQGYTALYPIQEQAIPAILKGKDVLGIAQTGSGKTAAFALPILELLQKKTTSHNRFVKCLVLVPTRELAIQVEETFYSLSLHLPQKIKTLAVYGGVSINPQMMKLSGTDVLVATPGRLLDLIDHNAVKLSEVEILVLDEADKMLNLGFKEEMDRIFGLLPAQRQNLLFSATLGGDIQTIVESQLRNPVTIAVEAEASVPELIDQVAYQISPEKKGPLLRYLIKQENMEQVLVFASSIRTADNIVGKLKKNGVEAAALHGDKSQGARTEALKQFKAGKIRVLVATDLASRGIDIKFLPFVINYELPRSPKDYVHRIGRTGRAEASGKAISLITPEDAHHFKIIQKKMGKQVPIVQTDDLDLKGV